MKGRYCHWIPMTPSWHNRYETDCGEKWVTREDKRCPYCNRIIVTSLFDMIRIKIEEKQENDIVPT